MAKHDCIARLNTFDARAAPLFDTDVGHSISSGADDAIGGGDHRYALPHDPEIRDPNVGAIVAVIAQMAAPVITKPRADIMIEVILNRTLGVKFTVDWKA
jgi:hypothetical protein